MDNITRVLEPFKNLPLKQKRVVICKEIQQIALAAPESYRLVYVKPEVILELEDNYPDLVLLKREKRKILPDAWSKVFSLNDFLKES
jgi:hypothetical protein